MSFNKNDKHTSLGTNIKNARIMAGLTQVELANKINERLNQLNIDTKIGNTAVSMWECDKSQPDADTIESICKITGVEPNILLNFQPDKLIPDIELERRLKLLSENEDIKLLIDKTAELTEEEWQKVLAIIDIVKK